MMVRFLEYFSIPIEIVWLLSLFLLIWCGIYILIQSTDQVLYFLCYFLLEWSVIEKRMLKSVSFVVLQYTPPFMSNNNCCTYLILLSVIPSQCTDSFILYNSFLVFNCSFILKLFYMAWQLPSPLPSCFCWHKLSFPFLHIEYLSVSETKWDSDRQHILGLINNVYQFIHCIFLNGVSVFKLVIER